jgi:acetyl esterase/lipase
MSILRKRFAGHIVVDDGSTWRLRFDEGRGESEMYVDNASVTDGFAVNKPPDHLGFWKIIAGLLQDLPCVLYWPGGGAVMGSLDLLPHLPRSFIEKLGIPFVSTDPERIRRYVGENS